MNKPLYEKIYIQLKQDIVKGKFKVGDKIPSEKELSEQWSVSRITPKKSLDILADEGIIERNPGRGSFVVEHNQLRNNGRNIKVSNNTQLIGLIIPNLEDNYGIDLVNNIESEAGKSNCFIILKRSLGDAQKEKEIIQELLEIGVSAFIILPSHAEHFNQEILKLVYDDFPIVLIDRYLRGVPAVSVCSDNRKAAKEATEYLFGLGHENICLLSRLPDDTSALEERNDGFIDAYVDNNIKIEKHQFMNDISSTWAGLYGEETIQEDTSKIRQRLKTSPDITAFLAVEYRIALLAESAVKEMGLSIPEDISIVCFDSTKESTERRKFTFVQQNEKEMGKQAVESVLKMINGEKIEDQTIRLETAIVEGTSTNGRLKYNR
ncbi:GntR family transcriptional regulator [Lentibacillus salicampi]|uniref:GntR family transcriptional regulator n=1 Tax=Lentibacillus salicampi TaxID=175306 RepID=A0A4Y9ACR5_9BACI|nr:GntR family transcriptional regulator [Lentibacillus salicampi]TFJ92194.1 GntR family transcriptional regulator [Lentibacillus salicampi]